MAQSRPNPFRGLHDVFTEMERMRRLGRGGVDYGGDPETHSSAWIPAADIFADGMHLVIRLELPGVKPDDISITFDGGVLTISGERASDLSEEVTFYTRERYQGAFHRAMTLPEGVDESMITASFEDGVAEITVTGAARPAVPSRIPIADRSTSRATRVGARRTP